MKLTMLGTGNALATNCFNTCYVYEEQGEYLLVDGGGGIGVLRQLRAAGLDFRKIHHVFVTHKHVDHILGVIWMVRLFGQFMNSGEYEGEAWIYSHSDVIPLIEQISMELIEDKANRFIHDRIHLVTLEDRQELDLLGHRFLFFDIHSRKTPQFGYRMYLKNGEYLTCLGDERYNDSEEELVRGSKWLMHEAFCLDSQADVFHPYEKGHSTVKDACQLAQRLDVENLLLYHTEDTNIPTRKELYTAEGRQYFDGTILVPDDLEVLTIE